LDFTWFVLYLINNLEHVIFSSLSTVSQSLFFLSWSLLMQVGRYIRVQIMEVDEAKNNVILSEKEAWVSTKIAASRCLVSNLYFFVCFLLFIFWNFRCQIDTMLQEKLYLREGTLLEGTEKYSSLWSPNKNRRIKSMVSDG
jgi:hypothetical protein